MMAAPIEMRQYLRFFTLADAEAGIAPLRQMTAAGPKLFAPPQLQVRWKERTKGAGDLTLAWSDWVDVNYVREGDDEAPAP